MKLFTLEAPAGFAMFSREVPLELAPSVIDTIMLALNRSLFFWEDELRKQNHDPYISHVVRDLKTAIAKLETVIDSTIAGTCTTCLARPKEHGFDGQCQECWSRFSAI